jgi:monoterpene epsilon-lactone hydrolase
MRSQAMDELVAMIPADFAAPLADYQQVRQTMAPFHGHALAPDTHVSITELNGIRCGWCWTRDNATSERIIFYCHGGAFVSCDLDVYHFYAEIISRECGARVLTVDYRLAPEHSYPAAHNDCFDAYQGLLASGVAPSNIVVMGESCGGSLALAMLVRARDEGVVLPAAFVSLTGWFDLSVAIENAGGGIDPFLTPQWVRNRGRDYVGDQLPLDHPAVSPAFAELTGLSPMYLQAGEFDTVVEGVKTLAHNARAAGVVVLLEDWPEMIHGWHGLVNMGIEESVQAWRQIRRFLGHLPGKMTG